MKNQLIEEKKTELASWLLDPDNPKRFLDQPFAILEKKIKENKLEKILYDLELPLAEVLDETHKTGIKVDLKFLEKLSAEMAKSIASLEEKIYKLAGTQFNINSPKQMGEILFTNLKISAEGVHKTKTGQISTDATTLETIKDRHAIVPFLLDYREVFKIRSTYVEPLRELADENGRIHTTFLQTATATGRLSSQNPNLQNIPILSDWGKKLRKAFIAEKGYLLASFDYSQIELRVLASVAGDEKMIEAFKNNLDIHTATAASVYNIPLEKVTPEMRRFAKTLNFGVVYGMGPNAFAQASGLSRAEAAKFIHEYFSDFSDIKRWQEKTIQQARAMGYVENLNGRRRLLENINYPSRRFASEAERMAINMPIQGLAADIIKLAMLAVSRRIKKEKWDARLLLSIHDELIFEVNEKIAEKFSLEIKKEMEGVYKLAVPLKVESVVGGNWAELK